MERKMREIKCRSWISSVQRYVYFENGEYSYRRKGDNINIFDWDNVQQSTGLCDKNGVEIYEGDFIVITENVRPYGSGAITFKNGSFLCNDMPLIDIYLEELNCEVIGNIYENPELINK